METEKITHQHRLHQMQLDTKIKELELRADANNNKAAYLHREIEWRVVDKHRTELMHLIRRTDKVEDSPY